MFVPLKRGLWIFKMLGLGMGKGVGDQSEASSNLHGTPSVVQVILCISNSDVAAKPWGKGRESFKGSEITVK